MRVKFRLLLYITLRKEDHCMEKHCVRHGNVLEVQLPKELDHYTASYLREKIQNELLVGEVKKIQFDFSYTNFMDSSGIGLLTGRYRQMEALGGKIVACGVSKNLDKILELSGLYRIMEKINMKEDAC